MCRLSLCRLAASDCRPLKHMQVTHVQMFTGKELSSWLRSSSISEQCSQEQEDFELVESPSHLMASDVTRLSIMSNDSGIERDLPSSADAPASSLENPSIDASWEQYKR